MQKKEIIDLLVFHDFLYEETDKRIDVKIKRNLLLTLLFSDDLLVAYKEKIKYGWRWTSLYSMLRNELIGFFVLTALAIVVNLYIENVSFFTINVFFVCGIATFITGLCYYYYFYNQVKKTKIVLNISL